MGLRSPLLHDYGDDFAWSLLDAVPDATMVVSSAGDIVFVNDQTPALFGAPIEELVGRSVEDLLPDDLRAAHRAHRTRYRAEPTVRSMGAHLTLSARRVDGTLFPVEISLSPLRLGGDLFVVAAVRDITDRVESEDHMRRILQTLDSTDDAMFIFDAETLRYAFVNEGAVRLVGYSKNELLTMTPMHLNPYGTEAEYHALVDALLGDESGTITRQARMLGKDGTEVPVEKTYRSAPAGRDGRTWVISVARDISARLSAEAALRQSQQALHEAEQVVAIAEDRERIARDLHDTVIQRLFGEGLKLLSTMNVVDETVRPRLQATIDGLDQTIKDLRVAVFSLQGGPDARHVSGLRGRLIDVLDDANDGLGFEPRLQFDGPLESISDEVADHLVAVMREALSNVAKHAKARTVRVAVEVNDGEVTLTVTDDGVGVPDEVMGGHGLANMTGRARDLGGTSTITKQPGGGSVLVWRAPVRTGATRSVRQ